MENKIENCQPDYKQKIFGRNSLFLKRKKIHLCNHKAAQTLFYKYSILVSNSSQANGIKKIWEDIIISIDKCHACTILIASLLIKAFKINLNSVSSGMLRPAGQDPQNKVKHIAKVTPQPPYQNRLTRMATNQIAR